METLITIRLSRLLEMQERIRDLCDIYNRQQTLATPIEPFQHQLSAVRATLATNWLDRE